LISQAAVSIPTALYGELWVSLASLLRSYTALHGLNHKQQATVELGEDVITVRAGEKWLRLARHEGEIAWSREDESKGLMRFTIQGSLLTHVGDEDMEDVEEEMDMRAESWARELMQ
jgi:hypothetical protein